MKKLVKKVKGSLSSGRKSSLSSASNGSRSQKNESTKMKEKRNLRAAKELDQMDINPDGMRVMDKAPKSGKKKHRGLSLSSSSVKKLFTKPKSVKPKLDQIRAPKRSGKRLSVLVQKEEEGEISLVSSLKLEKRRYEAANKEFDENINKMFKSTRDQLDKITEVAKECIDDVQSSTEQILLQRDARDNLLRAEAEALQDRVGHIIQDFKKILVYCSVLQTKGEGQVTEDHPATTFLEYNHCPNFYFSFGRKKAKQLIYDIYNPMLGDIDELASDLGILWGQYSWLESLIFRILQYTAFDISAQWLAGGRQATDETAELFESRVGEAEVQILKRVRSFNASRKLVTGFQVSSGLVSFLSDKLSSMID